MTSGFDLGHDLDLEFSRSNIEFAISQPKMVRLPRNEKQTYWLNSRPQMWPMVWIYQIVTGVTSVVGVPSTHLVCFIKCVCYILIISLSIIPGDVKLLLKFVIQTITSVWHFATCVLCTAQNYQHCTVSCNICFVYDTNYHLYLVSCSMCVCTTQLLTYALCKTQTITSCSMCVCTTQLGIL